MKMLSAVVSMVVCAAAHAGSQPIVLTGATGRTGNLIYHLMKKHDLNVRALVRNASKARDKLGCVKCDESEGIFEGDITVADSLTPVMEGASAIVIATSAVPIVDDKGIHFPDGAHPIDIDWHGAKNTLFAFANRKTKSGSGHVAFISTQGTTKPEDPKSPYFLEYMSFYKLNFETELASSGLPFTIVKPCGLDCYETDPGRMELVTGHDDSMNLSPPCVARADVSRMMVAAIEHPEVSTGLRFDLCSREGTPTADADLTKIFQGARYPWQEEQVVV